MESSFSIMSSSNTNDCSNECTGTDSAGIIINSIVENQLIKNISKPPELISESKEKCSLEVLTNFEIPESIQALDDILSEFEEPESLPPNPGTTLHENHSEDDGYMSLNGRRCDVNDVHILNNSPTCINIALKESHNLPVTLMDITTKHDFVENDGNYASEAPHIQNTLPKTKSKVCAKSNYSSLPCSSIRSHLLENSTRIGSCSGERNILGIDISAVHNAVLRGGVAKLPEPIVNEHPVTIYPGRKSPNWNTRSPRYALCSIPAQKENSHKNKHTKSNSHPLPMIKKTIIFSKGNGIFNSGNESKEKLTEYEHEKYQYEEMLLHGTLDKELLTISTPAMPQKLNSIAWEINFNEGKNMGMPKVKKNIKDNSLKNNGPEGFFNINKKIGAAEETVKEHIPKEKISNPNINKFFKSSNDKFINDLSETNDHAIYDIKDNINNYDSTCDSMLGKGTFIIRKHKVQSSSFLNSSKPLTFQYQNGKTCNTNHKEYIDNAETTLNAKGSVKNLARARLSLDLEPEHFEISTHNQVTQYKSPLQKEYKSKIYSQEKISESLHESEIIHSYTCTSTDNLAQEDSKDFSQNIELICSESNPILLNITRKNNETCLKVEKVSSTVIHLNNNQAPVKVSNDLRSPGAIAEHISSCTPSHRELAPPLEEEEEQCSESQSGCAPLRQIEHNISALLRGDIAVVRVGDSSQSRRSLNYRPGVHKSESAKEMLLSQNAFGPLPPSPPSSSPEINNCGSLPPLPPSPSGTDIDDNVLDTECIFTPVEIHSSHNTRDGTSDLHNKRGVSKYHLNDIPLPPLPHEHLAPAIPPHRGSIHFQTIRSRSIDSNYTRKCPMAIPHSGSSVITTGYSASTCDTACTSRRNIGSYGNKRNIRQSPREEQRLQTSCSLPETPIFSRGCDIARTPYRRQTENTVGSGSRTAPRASTSHTSNMGSSIVGISGGNTLGVGVCRQRTISHVLASGEVLRLSGGPARGWYPKHRSMRPASTENIDRLPQTHSASMRVWDSAGGMTGTGQIRKPLTLPPNLTPSFLNKSPREALRRVTSLLINKKGGFKERENKISKENMSQATVESSRGIGSACKITLQESSSRTCNQKSHKKKGFFKQFWKKSKHYSLEQ